MGINRKPQKFVEVKIFCDFSPFKIENLAAPLQA